MGDTNQQSMHSVIRTFLEKKHWRLESLFPGNCIDNADKLGVALAKTAIARYCVAGATGLEPAASGVTGRRSNQTELRPPKSGEMVGDTRIELVTYGL